MWLEDAVLRMKLGRVALAVRGLQPLFCGRCYAGAHAEALCACSGA